MDFFELLFAPVQLVPIIVGSIFLSIGVNYHLSSRRFENASQTVEGTVVAIERYVARTQTGKSSRKRTYYRPWVDFTYTGRPGQTVGPSIGHIRYRIGEKVPVQVVLSQDGRSFSAKVSDRTDLVVQLAFISGGLIALYVAAKLDTHAYAVVAVALFAVFAGHFVAKALERSDKPEGGEGAEPRIQKDGSVLLTCNEEVNRIHSALAMTSVFLSSCLFLSGGVMLRFYSVELPMEVIEMLLKEPVQLIERIFKGDIPSNWKRPLILNAFGVLLSVLGAITLFGSWRKLRANWGR